MLLSELLEEFKFNCECRRLSPKTTENYRKQIQFLLDFLEDEYKVSELEIVQPRQIKAFRVYFKMPSDTKTKRPINRPNK